MARSTPSALLSSFAAARMSQAPSKYPSKLVVVSVIVIPEDTRTGVDRPNGHRPHQLREASFISQSERKH